MLIRQLPFSVLKPRGSQKYNKMNNIISKDLLAKAGGIESIVRGFANMAGGKTLRFIDGNFAAQGWQGESFNQWQGRKVETNRSLGKPILSGRGPLKNSFNYGEIAKGEVRVYNNLIYAKVHNEGGALSVSGHTRTSKLGKQYSVKPFTLNMPKRQFAPTSISESPVLRISIERELIKELIALNKK